MAVKLRVRMISLGGSSFQGCSPNNSYRLLSNEGVISDHMSCSIGLREGTLLVGGTRPRKAGSYEWWIGYGDRKLVSYC